MDSLHAPCTPLKKAYDSCFNHWFEEYLAVAAPKPGSRPQSTLPLSSATPQAPAASTSYSNGSSSKDSIAVAAEGLSNENANPTEAEARQAKIRAKAEEYEKKCGDTWRAYRTCLEVGLQEKDLKQLIREAREEFPLKQPKEVNMDQQ